MMMIQSIMALHAGSRAAQTYFIEQAGMSRKATADLLRDILAAHYHGIRQATSIVSAVRGTREETDLAFIKHMSLSKTRDDMAAWINKSTYPGEEEQDRMLHTACSRGFERIIQYLVQNGADVNADDAFGETPLLHACRAGRTKVAKYLLRKRASVRPCGPNAETPLHWLFSFPAEHMIEMADLLIGAGSDISAMAERNIARGDGMERQQHSFASGTPLHRAVSRQAYKAVDCLLLLGAKASLKSSFAPFHSPLSLACSMNLSVDSNVPQTPITNLATDLVSPFSKDPECRRHASQVRADSIGAAPYTSSDFVSKFSILKRLLEACTKEDMNQLHREPYDARRLLDIALDSDPLLRVSVHGENWRLASRHTVRLLWLFGEDLMDKQAGFSSLHLACDAGNFEVVDEIIRLLPQSSLNATMPGRSCFIQTPLHYAVRGGHEGIVKLLLDKGADPTQRFLTDWVYTGAVPKSDLWSNLEPNNFDALGMVGLRSTLLHTCASTGCGSKIVKDLIRRGVRVNSYDSNWQSPLYLAIRACNFEVADILLEHGARLNELRDDLTMFGQLAEDGFSSPVSSFEYIINKLEPKDPAAFMANIKQSLTVFHKLMESEGSQRNQAWTEELILLFLRHIPDKRILDVQADGTADSALHVAVRNSNLLGVRLLLDAGADPNLPNSKDGMPFDLAYKLCPQLTWEWPEDIMDDHGAMAEYRFRRDMILETIVEKGGGWLRKPVKMFFSRIKARMKINDPETGNALEEEEYTMPQWASDNWFTLRDELGVDVKSVSAKETYYEGAIREIVEDIVADLQPLFLNRPPEFVRDPQNAVVKVLREHMSKTPEIFHSQLRTFRFELQMAWMLSGFSAFLLSFDRKDKSLTIGAPLEDHGSGGVGMPNLIKRRDRAYEQSTRGGRMMSIVGGGATVTTAIEDEEYSKEGSVAGEFQA